MSQGQRLHAVQMYADGATMREIGAAFGVDSKTVSRWVAAAEVPARTRGPRTQDWVVADAEIVALRHAGTPWTAIAQRTGVSRANVRRRYRAATEPDFKRWG